MSSRLDTLEDAADTGNISGALVALIFIPIVAFFEQLANAVDAGANLIIAPLNATGDGIANLMGAITGGAGDIVDAGAVATAQSFTQGPWGPLSYAGAIAAVIAGAYVFNWYRNMEETPDLLPFSGTDLPLIGDEGDN